MSKNNERPVQDEADLDAFLDPDSAFYSEHFSLSRPDCTEYAPQDAFNRVTAYLDGLEATVEDYEEIIEDLQDRVDLKADHVSELEEANGNLERLLSAADALTDEQAERIRKLEARVKQHEAAEDERDESDIDVSATLAKCADLERQLTHMTQELADAQARMHGIRLLLRP